VRFLCLSMMLLFVTFAGGATILAVERPELKLDTTLSAIANLDSFKAAVEYYGIHYSWDGNGSSTSEFEFSDDQRKLLAQNGFVVAPNEAEQFFQIYESHHFGIAPRIPNFITSDCVLQLYHLFYDFTLRGVEYNELLPTLETLTLEMVKGSRRQAETIQDPHLKELALKNAQFFAVAGQLLDVYDSAYDAHPDSAVEREIARIEAHEGTAQSEITGLAHDYTQYIVRGHYTRNTGLERFFKAMMWYGRNSFPFYDRDVKTPDQVQQAMLMTHALFHAQADTVSLIQVWDMIYSITTTYVGAANDLEPHEYYAAMQDVYGKQIPLESLADMKLLDRFYARSEKLRPPRITQTGGIELRFMGQRYIPDSYMLQKLTDFNSRRFPRGLDVLAVMGSHEAASLLDSLYHEPETWKEYLPRRAALQAEFAALPEKEWNRSLYSGWLYTLKALIDERQTNAPYFMRNSAWACKQLTTSLASWAEGRHDVILYATPSSAEGGDGEPPQPRPKGYVEPVPVFFARLDTLVKMTHRVLAEHGALPDEQANLFVKYEDMLDFLTLTANKELRGEVLNDTEYERVQYFGGFLEDLSLDILRSDNTAGHMNPYTHQWEEGPPIGLDGWFEVEGPDHDVACIADVHTSLDTCLEEAVGHVDDIYVAVPIEGKLYLTRGGVFSYHEFLYPYTHRLNDEAWQEMIKRGRAPDRPGWISNYVAE
jgi:hypothetical protein